MMISGTSAALSLLESVRNAQQAREDFSVSLLKKTLDMEKQQGTAMVNMLEQCSVPAEKSNLLDVYA